MGETATNKHEYTARIASGRVVCYRMNGKIEAGVVTKVNENQGWVEVRDVPGVLRLGDLVAVGIDSTDVELELDDGHSSKNQIYQTVEEADE